MGYMLLCENMLPSVLNFKEKYLSDEGIIIPRSSSISIAAFKAESDVAGFTIT
jgi:hypothetical protein